MVERNPLRFIFPNALTLARPFIAYEAAKAIREGKKGKAFILVGAAVATDADGTVARRLGETSKFGEIADPIADTAMRLQILRELDMAKGTKAIKAIAESAILITNVALFIASKFDAKLTPPSASALGKTRFVVDGIAATRLIAKPKDLVASWAIAGMSVLTAVDYINSARKTINGK